MDALWFWIIAAMLAVYAILDGFDLGAGLIHLFLVRTEGERRSVLAAVGPFWDGNEVWLLLAGGAVYCAFPAVYASRGFYLPAIVLVWLLILRGVAMEFRNRIENPLGRRMLDIAFGAGSILLALFMGAAAGFLISGTVNWFVALCAACGLACLTLQSATFMALKTTGELQMRCRRLASGAWWAVLLGYGVVAATGLAAQYRILDNTILDSTGICAVAVMTLAGMIGTRLCLSVGFDLGAFSSATCVIAGLLASAAFGLFPDVSHNLTVYNAATDEFGMSITAFCFIPALLLAVGYNMSKRRSLTISAQNQHVLSRAR